jgi:hypothetical protein
LIQMKCAATGLRDFLFEMFPDIHLQYRIIRRGQA